MAQASVASAPLQIPSVASELPLQQSFLVVAILGSLLVARRLSGADRRWGDRARSRLLLGVPWGTLLTILGVCLVYWVLQGGWSRPHGPVVIPYRSWSYFYPLGMLTSGFAHSGLGHLIGNLVGTVVFAPVAEWAWGHYPEERGSQTFTSPGTNPYARVLAVPAAAFAAGLATSLFALGPAVGFSGVVFAFAGFAFVTRPVLAVFALVSETTVRLVVRSLRNPMLTGEPRPGLFTPWWADVAIQGHALGIFLGVVLGVALLRRRGEFPGALSLWFAALVFAVSESLWAVYVPVGASEFLLFRAVGLGLTFVLAALVTSAVLASDRPLVERIDLDRREAATGLVLAVLLALAVVAVPFNLTTVGDVPETDGTDAVEVQDYTVTYVEGVPNPYGSVLSLSRVTGEDITVRSSGVVAYSERRRVWIEAVPKSRLTFAGEATVRVGGVGWHRAVFARRIGWSVVGNGSTYKVYLRPESEERRLAYVADPVRAEPVIDDRSLTVEPADRRFDLVVTRNDSTLGRAKMPPVGNRTAVGGLTLDRTGGELYAVRNDTRVRVAKKQVPRAEQNVTG
jgi:membrane associated rhomboid family serine protease